MEKYREVIKVTILLLVISNYLSAQNLVPNCSFECGTDRCSGTQTAAEFPKYACQWSCPSTATSDILSTSIPDKNCWASMPYIGPTKDRFKHIGSQLPRTGNRFAGIYTYNPWMAYLGTTWREYLQVKLASPLIIGEDYCAEMYVSRAEAQMYAANNLGFYFSTDSVYQGWYTPLPLSPQINESRIIKDTVNWVKIQGVFKATAPFRYLIIGNFYDDLLTQSSVEKPDAYPESYYFIDDVSVEKMPNEKFNFLGEIEICKGQQVAITASVGVANVSWTTLEDTLTEVSRGRILNASPQATTSYRVVARGCSHRVIDTVTVSVYPIPTPELGVDTTICLGTSLLLDAGEGIQYHWQDNSQGHYLGVVASGIYFVIVTNQFGCDNGDTIEVTVKDVPKVDLGPDRLVCDSYFPLHAGGGHSKYEWSTGSSDSVFLPSGPGKYWVTVENQCGEATDSVNINAAEELFIPNVITPNNDGLNDTFQVKASKSSDVRSSLKIFNRWGEQIFSANEYNGHWPRKNEELASGVYFYNVEYEDCPASKGMLQVLK